MDEAGISRPEWLRLVSPAGEGDGSGDNGCGSRCRTILTTPFRSTPMGNYGAVRRFLRKPRRALLCRARLSQVARAGAGRKNRPRSAVLHVPHHAIHEPRCGRHAWTSVGGTVLHRALLQYAEKEGLLRSQFGNFLQAFLFLLIAPLALWAWFYNRQERAWLWLFLALVWDSIAIISAALASVTTVMSQPAAS